MRIIPLQVSTSERAVDDEDYDSESESRMYPNRNDRIRYYLGYLQGLFCGTGSSLLPRSILCIMSIVIFMLVLSVYTSFSLAKQWKRGSSQSTWTLIALVLPSVCLCFGLFYLCRTYFATNLDRSYVTLYSNRNLPYIHRPVRATNNGNSRQHMGLHMAALTVRVMSHMLETAEGDPEALERLASEGITHERLRALRLLLTDRDFTNEDYDALLALEEIVAGQPGDPGHSGATRDQILNLPTFTYTKSPHRPNAPASTDIPTHARRGDYLSIPMHDSLSTVARSQATDCLQPSSVDGAYCSQNELLGLDDDEALQLAISLSLSEFGKDTTNSTFVQQELSSSRIHYTSGKVGKDETSLSKSATKSASAFIATNSPAESERSDSNACSICLDDYQEGDQLRILPCMHTFHTDCIDNWLPRNSSCPVCKMSISDPIWNATLQSTFDF